MRTPTRSEILRRSLNPTGPSRAGSRAEAAHRDSTESPLHRKNRLQNTILIFFILLVILLALFRGRK